MITKIEVQHVQSLYARGQTLEAMQQARSLALRLLPDHDEIFRQAYGEGHHPGPSYNQCERRLYESGNHGYKVLEATGPFKTEAAATEWRNRHWASLVIHACAAWRSNFVQDRVMGITDNGIDIVKRFERDDWFEWACEILDWLAVDKDAGLAIKPMQRQPAQDETIMQAISNLGLNPMNLQQPKGTPGDKAKIRAGIPNMSEEIFNKTWKRLRKEGRIQ